MTRYIVTTTDNATPQTDAPIKPFGVFDTRRQRFVASYVDKSDAREAARCYNDGTWDERGNLAKMDETTSARREAPHMEHRWGIRVRYADGSEALIPQGQIKRYAREDAKRILSDGAINGHTDKTRGRVTATQVVDTYDELQGDAWQYIAPEDVVLPEPDKTVPEYEPVYGVSRVHSGTEDGYLFYVVRLDGLHSGELVSGDGHLYEQSAQCELDDVRALVDLSPVERAAVMYLRSSCPAPGDYALAVIQDGQVSEYVQNQPQDRNEPLSWADKRAVLSRVHSWYAGSTEPYKLVTVDAETYERPDAAVIRNDINETAAGIWEVSSGEPSGDAREYLANASVKLSELVSMLDDGTRSELPTAVLEAAGYVTVYGRTVASEDALGYRYESGSRTWPLAKVEAVAAYAREWASDCQWGDVDARDFADFADTTAVTLAAAHYVGGLDALALDADIQELELARETAEQTAKRMRLVPLYQVNQGETPSQYIVTSSEGMCGTDACRAVEDATEGTRHATSAVGEAPLELGYAGSYRWTVETEPRGCSCGDPGDCNGCQAEPLACLGGGNPHTLCSCPRCRPTEPGAFGSVIDAGAARAAIDAARAWRASGDVEDDARRARDILGDLPSERVVSFLAAIARENPNRAIWRDYGSAVLDILAGY